MLCGLPGAGKSFFSSIFLENHSKKDIGECGEVIIVHFDDFESAKGDWDSESYKTGRRLALKRCGDILATFRGNEGDVTVLIDDNMGLHSMRRGDVHSSQEKRLRYYFGVDTCVH